MRQRRERASRERHTREERKDLHSPVPKSTKTGSPLSLASSATLLADTVETPNKTMTKGQHRRIPDDVPPPPGGVALLFCFLLIVFVMLVAAILWTLAWLSKRMQ